MLGPTQMQVWKFDDCDYVAAKTLEDAKAWYDEQYGPPVGDERMIEEEPLEQTMREGQGLGALEITLAERIAKLQAAGQTFPCVIAIDAHYA